ncbi:hypothetical protein [Mycobacterium simiae]|uniref:hypothetical protein n=1 Tax=Mycobacterium simiae TaxID=1784 RepID=UPI00041A9D0A|nr:hypothetical protein [Mycobacterium simiae]PLV47667.1 hypothetical protein X011_19470 [Mycobacterium tuberculosis variant microti OV254]BBX41676.1 hypothetical protein MSIM_31270 [Mycobacterium simiae]
MWLADVPPPPPFPIVHEIVEAVIKTAEAIVMIPVKVVEAVFAGVEWVIDELIAVLQQILHHL